MGVSESPQPTIVDLRNVFSMPTPKDGNLSVDASLEAAQDAATASKYAAPETTNVIQAGPSKIVGNQARKQEEVTRQGTQKMKFVPTLPVRRKRPEAEIKQEETGPPPKPVERGRGRGRGLGRGRSGPPPPRPEIQMTASGPFAMGPALGSSSKIRAPRSNFAPIMPTGVSSASLGQGLSRSGPPVLDRERQRASKGVDTEGDENVEVYSDPDEGVQIVDMDAIKTMDWMAPESLRRERDEGKFSKKKKKAEASRNGAKGKMKASEKSVETADEVEKDPMNALDLSESEEGEEMEDLIDDFATEDVNMDEDSLTRQEKLYFFQFPRPFPTFTLAGDGESTDTGTMVVDGHKSDVGNQQIGDTSKGKKVSFAQDVKSPAPSGAQGNETTKDGENVTKDIGIVEDKKLDGVIGQLEVHRSGTIQMRFGNGILMDVTAATQPSFLQHAVFLDPISKSLHVLGEVNRRFVVSPDVDNLLEEMDKQEVADNVKHEARDISMVT